MQIRLSNWAKKFWYTGIGLIMASMLFISLDKMFFHQDDLDWFLLANRSWVEVFTAPIGDHVNYLWRLLLKFEWSLFGLRFAPYAFVSIIMHAIVVWLIYLVTREISKRKDLAVAAAFIFSINTNWTETVLWISGQTISITAIFVLLAILAIWRNKLIYLYLVLASWTSALSLGLIGSSIIFDKKRRIGIAGIIIMLGLIYRFGGGDGTHVEMSLLTAWRAIVVWGLMIVNTAIGRTLLPFDKFEIMRIVLVVILCLWVGWRYRTKVMDVRRDRWSMFLLLNLVLYYAVVAGGRSQFGIGIMRAERYAYLGLILILLITARVLRNVKIKYLSLIVAGVVSVQVFGFWHRANSYIVRPQQMKGLFVNIENLDKNQCYQDDYLPNFVLEDDRLKYSDLLGLWHSKNIILRNDPECLFFPE